MRQARQVIRWCIAGLLTGALPTLTSCQQSSAVERDRHAVLVSAARGEAALTIYSTTDRDEVDGLLRAFFRRHPGIRIDYRELTSTALFDKVVQDTAQGRQQADLLWSTAMDLQTKLVNDGYAQTYASPQKRYLPAWAIWKDQAWGTTAEPVVIAYNRETVRREHVPQTRIELTRLLERPGRGYWGKVVMLDPERSSAGYLFLSQDWQVSHDTAPLVEAIRANNVGLYATNRELFDALVSKRAKIAYNVFGSYALERQLTDPSVGIIMPRDYTLIVTRIALILKDAPHPNAAKLFLDFMLSKEGQTQMAQRYMTPVRADVPSLSGSRAPDKIARNIRISPALIANVDELKRRRLLNRWQIAHARSTAQGEGAE